MEDLYIEEQDRKDLEQERYGLALERIREMGQEEECDPVYRAYFQKQAAFAMLMEETYQSVRSGEIRKLGLEELQERNRRIYEDILPENYGTSYANPDYAQECFGKEMGQLLSALSAELRGMIPAAYEENLFDLIIRMELLLEVYQAFLCAAQEKPGTPDAEEIRQILYWYFSDYYEPECTERTAQLVDAAHDFARRILMESDLSDLRYLYWFGEYITENELATARHLLEMPEEKVRLMADTYTEGYRIGFEVGNKDISIKKTVNIRYCLGFERMIRKAVENFEKIGLQSTIYRAGSSLFQGRTVSKNGFFGANPNKQFDYDHKEDLALLLDRPLVERRLESTRNAYERWKEEMGVFGGPAVVEIFGEKPFVPQAKESACRLNEKQQKLSVEYAAKAGALQNRYIKGEERSFTIIAFPVPDIGERYEEIFDEIVKINTLDYKLYQGIQQKVIDALDQGSQVHVKGTNGNRTDLTISLHTLTDPAKQTNFENCVADVNIPVGEVFTSPVLKGTNGILHVTRVFLNELEYRDIWLEFKDGMIADYGCSNFDDEEENRKYIRENVLFHHETLPMGEFAVGTNTTAYVAARRYGIEDKMPILIAEKTGPHFAVGDTCYSHAESVVVYNPDGKEIIAKDNEVSLLRDQNVEKAYFQCHTDITIPYDELGELYAQTDDGRQIRIIENGRFVLPGCEELNRALDEADGDK